MKVHVRKKQYMSHTPGEKKRIFPEEYDIVCGLTKNLRSEKFPEK